MVGMRRYVMIALAVAAALVAGCPRGEQSASPGADERVRQAADDEAHAEAPRESAKGSEALASDEAPSDDEGSPEEEPELIDIPNARIVEGVLAGGQPEAEHLERAAESGYETVINLQEPTESGVEELAGTAEELDLDYTTIPIDGAADLTPENAEALAQELEEAEADVIVHCKSGNRVGALFALKAYHVGDASPKEAEEIGYRAGMTALAGAVRERLGLE